jgi:hypothetical protein
MQRLMSPLRIEDARASRMIRKLHPQVFYVHITSTEARGHTRKYIIINVVRPSPLGPDKTGPYRPQTRAFTASDIGNLDSENNPIFVGDIDGLCMTCSHSTYHILRGLAPWPTLRSGRRSAISSRGTGGRSVSDHVVISESSLT